MADEWWSSSRADGASAGLTAPPAAAAESATSTASADFQTSLHDAAATTPSSFLADPHMDWTQACVGGRGAAEATTSFNALLQLQGEASRNFLLDQPPQPPVPAQYDGDGGSAAVAAALLYADNQYSSSVRNMPASTTMDPFPQQQFSGFPFGTSGFVGVSDTAVAADEITKPPQALEPRNLKSGVQDACCSVTRRSAPNSPAAVKKKPRIETPFSPLPTFKVRKEKLGDRITALQQLVSPFGKTDTASVLHEAIEYIKFLHDQVASLSSPYLRCGGRPAQLQQQQVSGKAEAISETKGDLRSRGLCLVPLASTYSVANETTPEFWHPTFGGTFR